jgi:hypothetical protein
MAAVNLTEGKTVYAISNAQPGWAEGVVYRGKIQGGEVLFDDESTVGLDENNLRENIQTNFNVRINNRYRTYDQTALAAMFETQQRTEAAGGLMRLHEIKIAADALNNLRTGGKRTKRKRPRRKRKSRRK